MDIQYFNYMTYRASGWWDRGAFIRKWWRLYAGDPRWVPPYYPSLWQALDSARNSYLAQRTPFLLHLEALPRRRQRKEEANAPLFSGALMEEPVAAAVILADTRPVGGVAYVSLLHCVNDPESLERLWGEIMEHLWTLGCRRVLGPTGLSPYLEQGVLHNYFHVPPPLHTPYNPPYVPELIEGLLEPVLSSQLFHRPIPAVLPVEESQVAQLIPLDATRLAGDLLPLFAAACSLLDNLPLPAAEDVTFLLQWLHSWPLYGWLAQVEERPVGFILMQPDLARALRRANGGRNLAWRLWLNWRSQRPVRSGRLLFGAVLPEWRGQGIGGQLWRQALRTGQAQGWQSLTIGPVASDSPAAHFLTKQRAQAQQRYVLYGSEL